MNNCYVYRHIRLDNNQVFYVGIGTYQRNKFARAHSKTRSDFWKNTAKKYGYRVEIVMQDISWDDACKKEIELIEYYGRIVDNTGSLVNLTKGGDGILGYKMSEETIKKMREVALGRIISPQQREIARQNALGNKNCVGYKHNEEFKVKCRENNLGKKMSEESKRKIGNFWRGKPKSEEEKKKIANTLKGRMFPLEVREKIRQTLINKGSKIEQYDKDGNFIARYNNAYEAAKAINRSVQSVKKASYVNSKVKTAGGFIFKAVA